MNYDDDFLANILMGNTEIGNTELGESLRGMQEANYLGASQKALTQLRGALGQVALQNFGRHVPMQKRIPPAFKDSTQLGILCEGSFVPSNFSATSKPTIFGDTRVQVSFKPTKAILTESLIFTWSNDTLGETQTAANVTDASDLLLTQAFAGAINCFPNAPNQRNGVSGQTFSSGSLGNGISWPTLNTGQDVSVGFAIRKTALFQGQPPAGYSQSDLIQIDIEVNFNLLGPQIRA